MARNYRVVHQRKTAWEAMFSGRGRDWYLAQARSLFVWRTLKICGSQEEAEQVCRDHAGGTLVAGGGRVVAEFERPD